MIPSIEQHVEWITECVQYLRERGHRSIEATEKAEEAWGSHVNDVANATLYPSCNSWQLAANVPGKPRVFMPYLGFRPYVEKCRMVAAQGYEGFRLRDQLVSGRPLNFCFGVDLTLKSEARTPLQLVNPGALR